MKNSQSETFARRPKKKFLNRLSGPKTALRLAHIDLAHRASRGVRVVTLDREKHVLVKREPEC